MQPTEKTLYEFYQERHPHFSMIGKTEDPLPTHDEFEEIIHDYLSNLSPKKRDKALIDHARYRLIQEVLKNPRNTSISTAQFRFWVKKMFHLQSGSSYNIVIHDNKPVAMKEQIYNILAKAHKDAHHGGRDKTSAIVRNQFSWIPKELIARFVRQCPTCISRRNGNQPLNAYSSKTQSPQVDFSTYYSYGYNNSRQNPELGIGGGPTPMLMYSSSSTRTGSDTGFSPSTEHTFKRLSPCYITQLSSPNLKGYTFFPTFNFNDEASSFQLNHHHQQQQQLQYTPAASYSRQKEEECLNYPTNHLTQSVPSYYNTLSSSCSQTVHSSDAFGIVKQQPEEEEEEEEDNLNRQNIL